MKRSTRQNWESRWFANFPDLATVRADPRYQGQAPDSRAATERIWNGLHPPGGIRLPRKPAVKRPRKPTAKKRKPTVKKPAAKKRKPAAKKKPTAKKPGVKVPAKKKIRKPAPKRVRRPRAVMYYFQYCVSIKTPGGGHHDSFFYTIYTDSLTDSHGNLYEDWGRGDVHRMCGELYYILCLKRHGELDEYNPRILNTCEPDAGTCATDCLDRAFFPKYSHQGRKYSRKRGGRARKRRHLW